MTTTNSRILAAAAMTLALTACGVDGSADMPASDVGNVDETPATPPVAPEAPVPTETAPTETTTLDGYRGDGDCLGAEWPRCQGRWADLSDSTTRWIAHPDTGLVTFACAWQDPRCDAQWYSDERCGEGWDAKLAATCERVGGTCEAGSDGVSYCVAR